MDDLVVIKRNLTGEETWRYSGRMLERGAQWVRLEAFFNRDDRPFHGIVLGRGDRFVETFYSDRGYNIFEMHAREDDALKGWYCNVCRPAELGAGVVSYVDLALDLLVYPDYRQLVLDEDEFAALTLDLDEAAAARQALRELQNLFTRPA